MTDEQQKIQLLCLEVDAGLKTLRKALMFDEDDSDSFQNTYEWIIDRLLAANWEIHQRAEQQRISIVRRNLRE